MKKLSFLFAALIVSVCSVMAETVAYTLTPVVGKNSAYASNEDVTIGDIQWNVTGNVTVNPWRLGGKNITAVDRALYSKTAIAKNISKIEITHAAGNITVNSMKLIVSAAANETGEELTGTYTSAGTTTFTRPTGSDWTGKYYKIVYNVTNSANSNKYVAFSEAKFYTDETAAVLQPVFTPEEGKVTDGSFTESFTLTMSCETADATIYYTLDGTNPAEETALTYLTPITIPATSTKVRAIAKKGVDESFETEQVYAFINSPATAYTVTEAKAVIDKALGLDYELYGKGTIKSIKGYYDSKYITYTITDGANDLTVYNGLGLEKAAFTAATDLSIGDQVVICGKLVKFSGTYEFNKDNYLISLTPAPKYTITALVNDEKMGTVSGAGEYKVSTEATLTAIANTGYEFVNWTDAEGATVSTDAKYTFTVTAAATYTANFAAKTFDVLTDVNDETMGSVEGTPTNKVAYGTEITLTAKPNTGFEFVNWTDLDNKEVSTKAAYTFTVTEDVALIANFQAKAVPTVVELFTYTTDQSWGVSTFEGAKFRDVAVHNGVAYALKNGEARIVALDAKTGAYIQDLDMTDVSGGAITLSAIQTLADGTLLAINCQTNCATDDVKVYQWADKDATPEVLFAGKLDEALRIDAFYYEGTLENGAIWTSYSGGEKGSTCKAIKIPVVSGVAGDFESYVLTTYALETSSRVISASDSEIAIATKGKMYTWTINADKTTTIKYYTEIGNKRYSNNVKLFEFGGSKYMATVYWGDTSGTISSPQIIVSTYTALGRWSTSGLTEVFKSPAEGLGTGRNTSFFNGLDVVVGTKGFYVYMTSINGGITACYYGEAETPTEIEDITPSEVVAPKAVKVFRNGQVLILVGDKTYNVMGQVIE